jgi:glycogen synthase
MARPVKKALSVLMTTDGVGGVWSYALGLIEALQSHRVEVTLATMGPALSEDQRRQAGRLPHLRLRESTFRLEWMNDPWADVDRAGRWLLDLEETVRPDVVHLNGYAHAALPWSRPTLVVAHSCVCSWFQAVRSSEPPAEWDEYRRRVRRGLAKAGFVVAPTAAALQALARRYGPFAESGVIHNGCAFVEETSGKTEPVVLTAGRFWDPAKNAVTLDRAAREIRWPVWAAGATTGPDGQRISLDAVRSLGHLDSGSLWSWYRRTRVFIMPSVYEPFGLTALEAAMAGCALVLADIPSLREVWGDAAVFVPPRDHRALAGEVNRLMEWDSLRQQYGRRARARALTYTPARMAFRYHHLYRRLMRDRSIRLSKTPLAEAV